MSGEGTKPTTCSGSFLCRVYYLGTRYSGFQYQGTDGLGQSVPSVQEEMEKALVKVLLEEEGVEVGGDAAPPIRVTACSRTDASVHATGMVAQILIRDHAIQRVVKKIAPHSLETCSSSLTELVNAALPSDIALRDLIFVPDGTHTDTGNRKRFSVHRDIEAKQYSYYVGFGVPLEAWSRFSHYCYSSKFDRAAFEAELQSMVGTHDFQDFTTGSVDGSTVRSIISISIDELRTFNESTLSHVVVEPLELDEHKQGGEGVEVENSPSSTAMKKVKLSKRVLRRREAQHPSTASDEVAQQRSVAHTSQFEESKEEEEKEEKEEEEGKRDTKGSVASASSTAATARKESSRRKKGMATACPRHVKEEDGSFVLRVRIMGKGFLRYMIRNMIGTALMVATTQGSKKNPLPPGSTGEILRLRDENVPLESMNAKEKRTVSSFKRCQRKIAAKGLWLEQVWYRDGICPLPQEEESVLATLLPFSP